MLSDSFLGAGVEVTPSAVYSMDDAGGFDNYILRTPPQDTEAKGGLLIAHQGKGEDSQHLAISPLGIILC